MAKRRTRKDKIKATHNFQVSWQPRLNKQSTEANVKRQLNRTNNNVEIGQIVDKNAVASAKPIDLIIIKRDIFKSLGLAGLILIIELMIYLIRNR